MRRLAASLLASVLGAGTVHAASVTVTIAGVHNDHGHILVALCTKATFLRPHCPWRGSAPAHPGEVTIRIDGVPPGTYAAQAFHDEDDNGRLNRSMLGLPKEAMGFSNDAPMRMGPPKFDAAAFEIGPRGTTIRLTLRYF